MNTLNKKLIVLALAATPFTAFGQSLAPDSDITLVNTLSGSFTTAFDVDANDGSATFVPGIMEFTIDNNSLYGYDVTMESLYGGLLMVDASNNPVTALVSATDGQFLDLSVTCANKGDGSAGNGLGSTGSTFKDMGDSTYATFANAATYGAGAANGATLISVDADADAYGVATVSADAGDPYNSHCTFGLISGETITELLVVNGDTSFYDELTISITSRSI